MLKNVAQRTNMGFPVILFNRTSSIVAAEWPTSQYSQDEPYSQS